MSVGGRGRGLQGKDALTFRAYRGRLGQRPLLVSRHEVRRAHTFSSSCLTPATVNTSTYQNQSSTRPSFVPSRSTRSARVPCLSFNKQSETTHRSSSPSGITRSSSPVSKHLTGTATWYELLLFSFCGLLIVVRSWRTSRRRVTLSQPSADASDCFCRCGQRHPRGRTRNQ